MEIKTRAKAIAEGESKYFTGKPCKSGHLAYRYTQSATCAACLKASSESVRSQLAGALGRGGPMSSEDRANRQACLDDCLVGLIRAYVDDMPAIRALAGLLLVTRYPALNPVDAVIQRPPTDGQGGANLYKFRMHPSDVEVLKAVSNDLLNQHGPNAQAAREAAIIKGRKYIEMPTVPVFRP